MRTILGVISEEERGYVQKLRELIPGVKLELTTRKPGTLAELRILVNMARASGCFVTVPEVARLIVPDAPKFTQDDFAGSCVEHGGIDYLIMNDISQIVTTSTGRHLAARYLSKLTSPEVWPVVPEFRYELCDTPDKAAQKAIELLSTADFIAYDIETIKQHLFFDVISFTGVFVAKLQAPEGRFKYSTRTYAFPHSDEVMQILIQQALELPIPKITQNGKYDQRSPRMASTIMRTCFAGACLQATGCMTPLTSSIAGMRRCLSGWTLLPSTPCALFLSGKMKAMARLRTELSIVAGIAGLQPVP